LGWVHRIDIDDLHGGGTDAIGSRWREANARASQEAKLRPAG